VVVDLKTIREISPIEEVQMINYLKITHLEVGLIINFGCKSLEWKRLILSEPALEVSSYPRNPRFQNLRNPTP
jgi:hypothetical protein